MLVSHSTLGTAPRVPAGTPPLPCADVLKAALSFDYFDRLYAQSSEQYIEMLDLYAHEYRLYLKGIDEALARNDEPAFRKIKHKIIYSLHLLELSELHHNMEVLASQFAQMDGFERLKARHAYLSAFEFILEAITRQRTQIA